MKGKRRLDASKQDRSPSVASKLYNRLSMEFFLLVFCTSGKRERACTPQGRASSNQQEIFRLRIRSLGLYTYLGNTSKHLDRVTRAESRDFPAEP